MKKALALWNDIYHPKDEIEEGLGKALPSDQWQIISSQDPADLARLPEDIDLIFFFANRAPDEAPQGGWHPQSVQQELLRRIQGGMGAVFIHAGLTAYPPDSLMRGEIVRGGFVSHPEHCPTSFDPAGEQSGHPVLQGVVSFTQDDEHYFCQVDTLRTTPLAYATSAHGTTVAAWAHELGKGRVVCACPGHYRAVYQNPHMVRLMANMAAWATRQV